jgi:hypothetical protein
MRSEVLYTVDHRYDGGLHAAVLYDERFVQGYGRGSGSVDWGGRVGTIEWSNFPPMRADGAFQPTVTGVIALEGVDRPILYRVDGLSLTPGEDGLRLFFGSVRWFTDSAEMSWLNDVIGFEEGTISPETTEMRSRVFALHPDPPVG